MLKVVTFPYLTKEAFLNANEHASEHGHGGHVSHKDLELFLRPETKYPIVETCAVRGMVRALVILSANCEQVCIDFEQAVFDALPTMTAEVNLGKAN